jgi:hypothetical protein
MNYFQAYKDMREVFDHPCVEKALKFAAENPEMIYKKESPEYDAVVIHGFFDLYFSISRSTVEDEGA